MKLRAFAVRDGKVEQFFPPFFQQTPGQAQRSFTDLINEPKHEFARHPLDYALYEVGTFETDSGELLHGVPRLVVTGGDVIDVTDIREVSRG